MKREEKQRCVRGENIEDIEMCHLLSVRWPEWAFGGSNIEKETQVEEREK